MSKCKHCDEDIVWIDKRPYSLQSHFKVCRPDKKAEPKPTVEMFSNGSSAAEQAKLEQMIKEQS